MVKQYKALLSTENIDLEFTDDAIDRIAELSCEVNESAEDIGARRLHTLLEKLLEELSFDAPDMDEEKFTIDAAYVDDKLSDIVVNRDLSQYIL